MPDLGRGLLFAPATARCFGCGRPIREGFDFCSGECEVASERAARAELVNAQTTRPGKKLSSEEAA